MFGLLVSLALNKQWLRSQLATIIGTGCMAFLTLWLIDSGHTKAHTMLIFALMYLFSFCFLIFSSSALAKRTVMAVSSLLLFFVQPTSLLFGVVLCLFIASVQFVRDLLYIRLMGVYGALSEKFNKDIKTVIGGGMLIGIMMSVVLTPFVGWLSAYLGTVFFILVGVGGLVLAWQVNRDTTSNTFLGVDSDAESHINWLCALSMLANQTMFFVRFFVIPLMILKVSLVLGVEAAVLPIAGTIIGMMALVGFLFNKTSLSAYYRRSMYLGLYASLFASMLICYLFGIDEESMSPLVIGLSLVAFFVLEVSSKVWSVNFMSQLRFQAQNTKCPDSAFMAFARFKTAGGVIGYLLGYALLVLEYDVARIGVTLAVLSVISTLFILINRKDFSELAE